MPPAARGSFEKPPLDPAKLFIFVIAMLWSSAFGQSGVQGEPPPGPRRAAGGKIPLIQMYQPTGDW
jgi:hypothetical protein